MELQLKHLAPYLPYELKCQDFKSNITITLTPKDLSGFYFYESCKPILRPLSDWLDNPKHKAVNEIHNVKGYFNTVGFYELPYYIISLMFEEHIDVFGLIEKGLAIDINTLK